VTKPVLVSLFSGCGGLDLGLERAGFDVRVCVEAGHDACESLRLNGVAPHILEQRIQDVSSPELMRLVGIRRGELALLAGGPPCPPYSKSRFYRKEKPRALEDPTSDTLHEYLRVLRDLHPKAFLIENVPGLAYRVHADALDLILREAGDLGYAVNHRVINAADYGVPQIRERLFIVGSRLGRRFEFPPETHISADEPASLFVRQPWVTAGTVLEDLDTDEAAKDDGHRAGGQYRELLGLVPPGDNYLFFTKERGHPKPVFEWRSRYWSFLLKLSPDKPSWTIQARRSNNMGPFHWRNRILRIDEIKRLQTFPDSWELAGRVDSAWRQIGNAVPPVLAQQLGIELMRLLSSYQQYQGEHHKRPPVVAAKW
jgi:DNA-methyltransferase (dcm)